MSETSWFEGDPSVAGNQHPLVSETRDLSPADLAQKPAAELADISTVLARDFYEIAALAKTMTAKSEELKSSDLPDQEKQRQMAAMSQLFVAFQAEKARLDALGEVLKDELAKFRAGGAASQGSGTSPSSSSAPAQLHQQSSADLEAAKAQLAPRVRAFNQNVKVTAERVSALSAGRLSKEQGAQVESDVRSLMAEFGEIANRGVAVGLIPAENRPKMDALIRDLLNQVHAAVASQPARWWEGIKPHTLLTSCHYTGANAKEEGVLKVTEDGLAYKGYGFGSKVKIPWTAIRSIRISETQARHGHQRSAVGIGPVGVAVVGAAMIHNRRAAQIDTARIVTVTDRTGRDFHFVPKKSTDAHLAAIRTLIQGMP